MKIDELKDGCMVVQCVDTKTRSPYTPSVRRTEFTAKIGSDGIMVEDEDGIVSKPDFSKGRWYAEKARDWTPDEMEGLVGRIVNDDYGIRLIVEYSNADGTVSDASGSLKIGPHDAGSFFGEKYDLVRIE